MVGGGLVSVFESGGGLLSLFLDLFDKTFDTPFVIPGLGTLKTYPIKRLWVQWYRPSSAVPPGCWMLSVEWHGTTRYSDIVMFMFPEDGFDTVMDLFERAEPGLTRTSEWYQEVREIGV